MTEERIQDFFDWLVARLFEGELDWLDDVFVYPMSIFIGEDIRIETGPFDTENYLKARRRHARENGVFGMSANVIQISRRPHSGHFSAYVEYLFHGTDGRELARNKALYRCHMTDDDRIMVESVELLDIGLPFSSAVPKARRH